MTAPGGLHLPPRPGDPTVRATVSSANPFSAGFRAARANLIPGLIIQVLMVALVLAYYFFPAAHAWFAALAAAKGRWGFAFSFSTSVLAGAVLPAALTIVVVQRGRVTRGDLTGLVFLCLFWGMDGVIIDAFYRLQAVIFGAHADLPVVVKKVLVDQFIYNPLFAAPYTVACFEFKNQGYRPGRTGHVFTGRFYREQVVPALCATWAIWIPVTSAIYALPSLLQIPLFALALSFWSLLVTYITSRENGPEPVLTGLRQVVPD
jgi:hypothetical protein